MTRQGGRMSRASISHAGRSGKPNLMGSQLDPAGLDAGSQTNDFKIDTCRFLARCSTLLGYDME